MLLALADPRGPRVHQHLRRYGRLLHDGALRGEIAVEDCEAALRGQGSAGGLMTVPSAAGLVSEASPMLPPSTAGGSGWIRFARDSSAMIAPTPPASWKSVTVTALAGLSLVRRGRLAAQMVEVWELEVGPDLPRQSEEMQDQIGGAAERQSHADGVVQAGQGHMCGRRRAGCRECGDALSGRPRSGQDARGTGPQRWRPPARQGPAPR